jgi:DNA polymerase-3 subunit beta
MKIPQVALSSRLQKATRAISGSREQASGVYLGLSEDKLVVLGLGETQLYTSDLSFLLGGVGVRRVDHKRLGEFVQNVYSEVEIGVFGSKLRVVSGSACADFPLGEGIDVFRYVSPPKTQEEFPAKIFHEALAHVLFSVSTDSSRQVLTCVYIAVHDQGRYSIVTTDGFRLSIVETVIPGFLDSPTLIPCGVLKELFTTYLSFEKPVSVGTSDDGQVLCFLQEDSFVSTRLVAGDFPPFQNVVPQEAKSFLILDRDELMRAVRLASIFSRDYSNIVIFEVSADKMTIRPKKESGQERIDEVGVRIIGKEQKELRIAFNYRYIIDFLSHAPTNKVTMGVNRSDSPTLFLFDEIEDNTQLRGLYYKHVIMPVRVQE